MSADWARASFKHRDEVLEQIAIFANGDARSAYNMLELAAIASGSARLLRNSGRCAAAQNAAVRQVRRGAF